jgi:hypothetical protein
LERLDLRATDLLAELLRRLSVREVQLHHLADLPTDAVSVLPGLCSAIDARLQVMIHDYYFVCPRINLVDAGGVYCGEPEAAQCDSCLASDGMSARTGGIVQWRSGHVDLLRRANSVAAPDVDVAQRFARYAPGLAIHVQPHEPPIAVVRKAARGGADSCHVLVVGALSLVKGLEVVKSLARSTVARAGRMRLTLLGHSSDDEALVQAGVAVLGRYDDATLDKRIQQLQPDLIFVPSVWPETYCYVLSAALQSGFRVAVFDIGAQARRAREADAEALVLPLSLAGDAEALAAALTTAKAYS